MSNTAVVVLFVPKFITNSFSYLIKDLYVKKEKGETEIIVGGKSREREIYIFFSLFFLPQLSS
jgi:hypothetical protein